MTSENGRGRVPSSGECLLGHEDCGWTAVHNAEAGRVCSCEWTPGIDLPTAECDLHWDDPTLAHRSHTPVWCAECGTATPRDTKAGCPACGCVAYTTRRPDGVEVVA